MQIEWNKRSVSCYEQVFSTEFTDGVTADSVVPDVLPDIEEIVRTEGMICLRSKEHQDGHLILTANLSLTVLYRAAEDMCPQRLTMELPYEKNISAGELTAQNISQAEIRLCTLTARALNPRKVQVQADLLLRIRSFLPGEISLAEGVTDAEGTPIYTKTADMETDITTGVMEKSFVLTDEYPLSGTRSPARELVSQQVTLHPEECKFVGTKLIFKGIVKTDLLWLCEDDSLCAASFTSGFSQIMETDTADENASASVSLSLTGAYLEMFSAANDAHSVSAQLNIVAQACISSRQTLRCITDVYCNRYALEAGYGGERKFCVRSGETLTDNMRGMIELPCTVQEVLRASAFTGKWSGTETGFACPVNVSLLFRDGDGVLHGIDRCFTAEWTAGDAKAPESVYCAELHAMPASNGIEVRLAARAEAISESACTIFPLESLAVADETPIDTDALPSVIVLPDKNGDHWALAKMYHSTVEMIEAANLNSDSSVLLIPKAK